MNQTKWVHAQMKISQIPNVQVKHQNSSGQIPNEFRPNTNTQLSNKGRTTKSKDN